MFSSPKNFLGSGAHSRGGDVTLVSPLIDVFQPLLVVLFLVVDWLLGLQRGGNEELWPQRRSGVGLQSQLALQQVELLFDVVVELVLVPHSLVEDLQGLGRGDSLLHGHSHVAKFPMLWVLVDAEHALEVMR